MRRRRSAASGSTFAARSVPAYSCADAISTLAVSEAVAKGLPGACQRLGVELLAVPPHRPREAMAARVPAHGLAELEPVDDRAHPVEQRLSAQRLPGHATPRGGRPAPRDPTRRARSVSRKPAAACSRRSAGGPLTSCSDAVSGSSSTTNAIRRGVDVDARCAPLPAGRGRARAAGPRPPCTQRPAAPHSRAQAAASASSIST